MHAFDRDTLLEDLNPPQREAVTHRDGPLLVLAGPGSGKTRVITRRAAYLVHGGVPPHRILAITFTNKAAGEMRERIAALGVGRGMWVHTFHALGVRLLGEFGHLAGVEPNFTICDDADQIRTIKEALADCGLEGAAEPAEMQAAISRAKNKMQRPEELAEQAFHSVYRMAARVYERYEALLRERNAVDFDDLLTRIALLLKKHEDVAEKLNRRFAYVLVDEYQDTNHAQYLIAHHLSRMHGNICVTGDPDQSIYAWRGADIGNILEFERDYPQAKVVRLEQNYRSTGRILRVASALIQANTRRKHKDLWTQRGEGEPVESLEFTTGDDEARFIARRLTQLREQGRPWSDMAICYRVNAISRGLEESLRLAGIPYKIARGQEFYNRKEIRDVLAYLRALVNPADQVALLRILNTPPRGIGKTSEQRLVDAAAREGRPLMDILREPQLAGEMKPAALKKVREFARDLDAMRGFIHGSVAETIRTVLSLSGLEKALREESAAASEADVDRWANVQELITAGATYDAEIEEPTLDDFLRRTALTSDQDAIDQSAGVVMLMTLHAAKGLEFPIVFIAGMEDGLLPHERALKGGGDIEEERRLCFVGITRAKEQLVLSRARERFIAGKRTPRALSQFLLELPAEELQHRSFVDPFAEARNRVRLSSRDDVIPMDDQLPPDEYADRRRAYSGGEPRRAYGGSGSGGGGRGYGGSGGDRGYGSGGSRRGGASSSRETADETTAALKPAADSPYAGWEAGTFVEHKQYGVGQVVWIRPSPGQTRAAIRFPRAGEKTFVLEKAPVRKLAKQRG